MRAVIPTAGSAERDLILQCHRPPPFKVKRVPVVDRVRIGTGSRPAHSAEVDCWRDSLSSAAPAGSQWDFDNCLVRIEMHPPRRVRDIDMIVVLAAVFTGILAGQAAMLELITLGRQLWQQLAHDVMTLMSSPRRRCRRLNLSSHSPNNLVAFKLHAVFARVLAGQASLCKQFTFGRRRRRKLGQDLAGAVLAPRRRC